MEAIWAMSVYNDAIIREAKATREAPREALTKAGGR
jgi:hypothetical protein